VSGSDISWTMCNGAPHSRQITTPAPHQSVFYRNQRWPNYAVKSLTHSVGKLFAACTKQMIDDKTTGLALGVEHEVLVLSMRSCSWCWAWGLGVVLFTYLMICSLTVVQKPIRRSRGSHYVRAEWLTLAVAGNLVLVGYIQVNNSQRRSVLQPNNKKTMWSHRLTSQFNTCQNIQ